jgi:TfoX/Sxy family transcriptional regulator of competence genes
MAYDRELAERIRSLLPPGTAVTERAMFGGLAFMVGGTMAIAAGGGGAVMVRVDPAEAEELMAATGAVPMEMRGRPMRGWLQVAADQLGTEEQLATWVEVGVDRARSLPGKSSA